VLRYMFYEISVSICAVFPGGEPIGVGQKRISDRVVGVDKLVVELNLFRRTKVSQIKCYFPSPEI
jgi:hypothetical protein